METTGKQITITREEYRYTIEPVMRNGKPTKRTKEVVRYVPVEHTASSYLIDGHEVYIIDNDLATAKQATSDDLPYRRLVGLYRADGTHVTCDCKYGRYGQANHVQGLTYDVLRQQLHTETSGYQGATGRGWGASVKRINW